MQKHIPFLLHKKPDRCGRVFVLKLVADVRNYSDVTSSLDSLCELSQMLSASTCDSSGKNLGSFGEILVELRCVLIIDEFNFICAEVTNLFLLMVLKLLLCILIHDNYLLFKISYRSLLDQNGRSSSDETSTKEASGTDVPSAGLAAGGSP